MAYSNYPKRQNLKILIYNILISETRKILKQNVKILTKVNNLDLKMKAHNAEFIDKFEALIKIHPHSFQDFYRNHSLKNKGVILPPKVD